MDVTFPLRRQREDFGLSSGKLTSSYINTFKYHVSCTDGKISVRINLLFYVVLIYSLHKLV